MMSHVLGKFNYGVTFFLCISYYVGEQCQQTGLGTGRTLAVLGKLTQMTLTTIPFYISAV